MKELISRTWKCLTGIREAYGHTWDDTICDWRPHKWGWFPVHTGANQGREATKHGCLLIALWLMWFVFQGFHSDEVSESSTQQSLATSHMCHSFVMMSCPNELLILLKRKCVPCYSLLASILLNKWVQTSPLTPWSLYHSQVFDHEMMVITWTPFKRTRIIGLEGELFFNEHT